MRTLMSLLANCECDRFKQQSEVCYNFSNGSEDNMFGALCKGLGNLFGAFDIVAVPNDSARDCSSNELLTNRLIF